MRRNVSWSITCVLILLPWAGPDAGAAEAGKVTGELKKWHRVTIDFAGPQTSETATPNPFTDYRLDVTFRNGKSTYVVPGYYAADGEAANTSATSGNVWRVQFCGDKTGLWTYSVSFKKGRHVAVAGGGSSAGDCDGSVGSFEIRPSDKTGRDHRGKGRLQYVGGRYLRFAETGEYFLKQGADAPENLFAYQDFDGDFKNDGKNDNRIKSFSPHVRDWRPGDPTWRGGKGKGLIGAINYLAAEGMNAFSFLPLNIDGDDKNVFPYLDYDERYRMDVSRLDQWEVVFEHADRLGMFIHFKTLETENELLLDGGDLGPQRKLYYRELIARFGHHLALNWNLGEEINNASSAQKKAWAQYFFDNDPYHHLIVIHNGANHYDLLGKDSKITGFSLQTAKTDFANVHSRVKTYLDKSAQAGKPWAVACDEPGDASHALRPDNDAGNSQEDGRKNGLWGTLMAGGWGNEWYFGYKHAHSDLSLEDFRSRDRWWDYCRYGLEFFKKYDIPVWEMSCRDDLTPGENDYCLCKPGRVYVIYLKNGGAAKLDLSDSKGTFEVQWYDPRHGGSLLTGTVRAVRGGSICSLGNAPKDTNEDWVILVRTADPNRNYPPAINAGEAGAFSGSARVYYCWSPHGERALAQGINVGLAPKQGVFWRLAGTMTDSSCRKRAATRRSPWPVPVNVLPMPRKASRGWRICPSHKSSSGAATANIACARSATVVPTGCVPANEPCTTSAVTSLLMNSMMVPSAYCRS